MVLPDEAELRETGTGSLLSQLGPPGPTGNDWLQGFGVRGGHLGRWWCTEGVCGVTVCELADGCPGMHFGEEGMCPNEGGTLDMGVSADRARKG